MITTGLIRCVSALKHHPLYTSSTPAPHRLHTTHVRGRWWNGVDTDMIRCWYGDGGSSMQRINGLDARKSRNSLIFLCGSVSRHPPRRKKFSTVRHFLTLFATNIYKGANFFLIFFSQCRHLPHRRHKHLTSSRLDGLKTLCFPFSDWMETWILTFFMKKTGGLVTFGQKNGSNIMV